MNNEDPLYVLTVFVMRDTASDPVAVGAGTLISPGLVLTALHVLCETGPKLQVAASRALSNIKVHMTCGAAAQPDGKLRPEDILDARLIWPRPGAPARSGGWDIALLALDNTLIDGTGKMIDGVDKLPDASVERLATKIQRHELLKYFGRLTLGLETDQHLLLETSWRFCGYPQVAQKINKQALKALGISGGLNISKHRIATVATLTPNADLGYFEGTSPSLSRAQMMPQASGADGEGNPLGGTSGAAIYGFHERGGVNRAYVAGVVSRALPQQAESIDALQFTPLPERAGARRAGPDAAASKLFWNMIDAQTSVLPGPLQLALDRLHMLDRRGEVRHFLRSYTAPEPPAIPRAYVFCFACTPVDLQDFFFRRLELESLKPSDESFAALFDITAMALQTHTYRLSPRDEEDAWLQKMAQHIGANLDYGDEAVRSVPKRLASCGVPRVLRLVLDPRDVFDRANAPTPWARSTLTKIMHTAARWAREPLFQPQGSANFKYTNPIVIVLAIVVNNGGAAEYTLQDFERVEQIIAPVQQLFSQGVEVPPDVYCAFLDAPLREIDFDDFSDWYVKQIDANEGDVYCKRITKKIRPQFETAGDVCRKAAIKRAIEELIDPVRAG